MIVPTTTEILGFLLLLAVTPGVYVVVGIHTTLNIARLTWNLLSSLPLRLQS